MDYLHRYLGKQTLTEPLEERPCQEERPFGNDPVPMITIVPCCTAVAALRVTPTSCAGETQAQSLPIAVHGKYAVCGDASSPTFTRGHPRWRSNADDVQVSNAIFNAPVRGHAHLCPHNHHTVALLIPAQFFGALLRCLRLGGPPQHTQSERLVEPSDGILIVERQRLVIRGYCFQVTL
jgi:hypothetical protein